jgi:hypothetical protein
MRWLPQNTAANITVFLVDSADHRSGKTGATLTVEVSKDGGAFSSISPTVTELSYGWYKLELTSSHTDTQGEITFHITAPDADPIDYQCLVVAVNPFTGTDQISVFDPTVDLVDGITYESAMEFLLAVIGGVTTVGASTASFKKRDGTTSKVTITYGEDEGLRTDSEINN